MPHENASCGGQSKPTIGIRFSFVSVVIRKNNLSMGQDRWWRRMPEMLILIRPWIVRDMVLRTLCRIHLSNCCEYTIDSTLNIACFDGSVSSERPRAYPVCWFDLSRCLYNEMMHTDYLRMLPTPAALRPTHARTSSAWNGYYHKIHSSFEKDAYLRSISIHRRTTFHKRDMNTTRKQEKPKTTEAQYSLFSAVFFFFRFRRKRIFGRPRAFNIRTAHRWEQRLGEKINRRSQSGQ